MSLTTRLALDHTVEALFPLASDPVQPLGSSPGAVERALYARNPVDLWHFWTLRRPRRLNREAKNTTDINFEAIHGGFDNFIKSGERTGSAPPPEQPALFEAVTTASNHCLIAEHTRSCFFAGMSGLESVRV